jgi:LuxR family maltose regulon positive regulatory protein
MLSDRLLERGQACFEPGSSALVLPQIAAGLIAYQQGRFEGLDERLRRALAGVDVINPIDFYARGLLCLARLQRLRGQVKEAQATLMEVQNLAARHQSWRFYAQAVGEEILALLQDTGSERLKRAEQRLKSVDWPRQVTAYAQHACNPVQWALGLSRIRLQQARSQYSEALHEITQLRALLQPGWHELQRLRLDLLAALSYQHLGYHERAQSLLVQCLLGAEREGVRSLFLEEGEGVRDLLQRLQAVERQPALQGFLRELIALWPAPTASGEQDGLSEALTERELEVIRLAAQGFSNDEIGRQLALALGTVKWHLHNIYEKLRVRNRTQAIRRARDLGVLA